MCTYNFLPWMLSMAWGNRHTSTTNCVGIQVKTDVQPYLCTCIPDSGRETIIQRSLFKNPVTASKEIAQRNHCVYLVQNYNYDSYLMRTIYTCRRATRASLSGVLENRELSCIIASRTLWWSPAGPSKRPKFKDCTLVRQCVHLCS